MSVKEPAPDIRTNRFNLSVGTPFGANAESKTEFVPRILTQRGSLKSDYQVPNRIGGHQFDGLGAEQSTSIEFTAIEQHLTESGVVRSRRAEAAPS